MRSSATIIGMLWFCILTSGVAHAASNLCTKSEETVFSCRFKENFAAVCASSKQDGKLAYIQYRFGSSVIEIAIPAKETFDISQISGQVFSGAHGGGEELNISNGDYAYQISTSWDMRNGNYDTSEIKITKDQKVISSFNCKPTTSLGRDDEGLRRLITTSGMKLPQ
jgi:hypothetical protein